MAVAGGGWRWLTVAGGGWRCTLTEFYDHFYLHFMDVAFDATEFTLTCMIIERELMSGDVLAMFWQCSSSVPMHRTVLPCAPKH